MVTFIQVLKYINDHKTYSWQWCCMTLNIVIVYIHLRYPHHHQKGGWGDIKVMHFLTS